jgi:hypothetical protein
MRKIVTGLAFTVLAGCAQAPELDESIFQVSAAPTPDAALSAEAGVELDGSLAGAVGTAAGGALPGLEAGAQLPGPGGGASGGIDGGGALSDAALGVTPISDALVGRASDAGFASSDAAQNAPDAAGGTPGGGTTGGATGGGTPGGATPGGGAMCNPATCTNQCLLLQRCCNEDNECACREPLTRQCILRSL